MAKVKMKNNQEYIDLEFITSSSGITILLDNYRIKGPKISGNSVMTDFWRLKREDILKALKIEENING